MFKFSKLLALVAVLTVAAPAVAAAPSGWRVYNNQQFGYSTCYPARLQQVKESTGPDGTSFWSQNTQASFTGERNRNNRSLIQHANSWHDGSEEAVQRKVGPNWLTETGTNFNGYFWRKIIKQGDRFITIQFSNSNLTQYRSIVNAVSACTVVR